MGEGEEGKEEEDGDLEDAWKMLEFARVIHEKQGSCTIETVDIITKLADVNCFKGIRSSSWITYAFLIWMVFLDVLFLQSFIPAGTECIIYQSDNLSTWIVFRSSFTLMG